MIVVRKIRKIQIGDSIPAITKKLTQEKINSYAQASGDFNPIHVDEEFARKTPFQGTIAHGMLSLAYASEMMWQWAGENWLTAGDLDLTFLSPARPGDTIVTSGKVKEKDLELLRVVVDVVAANQDGKVVFKGSAIVGFQ